MKPFFDRSAHLRKLRAQTEAEDFAHLLAALAVVCLAFWALALAISRLLGA